MAVHRFYTTESLSATSKRAWTPEGFLLCQDVPIARVGVLLYGRGEIPVQPNADGIIRIVRDSDEVFHPNAILSFAGKPATDEHPPAKVSPDNWKQYSIGTVLNPHQGNGRTENNELLYADLLIQDRQAINDVLAGKREVSAGYDAEYEQVKPGEGRQHNIIGNHVALVERGRCGPICSIGDSAMAKVKVVHHNKTTARRSAKQRQFMAFRDAVMTAFQTGDEETLVDELEKVPDMMGEVSEGDRIDVGGTGAGTADDMGGTHIHIHSGLADDGDDDKPGASAGPPGGAAGPPAASPGDNPPGAGGVTLEQLASRVDQLEQAVAILAQGDDGDDDNDNDGQNDPGMSSTPGRGDRKTVGDRRATVGDSTSMLLAFQEVMARAELLNPGQKRLTFDASKPAKVTAQTMCEFRRSTLDAALNKGDDAKDAIMSIAGQPKNPNQYVKQMSCDALTMVFNGASEMIRTAGLRGSNGGSQPAEGRQYGNGSVVSVQDTVAAINKKNAERYGIHK